MRNNGASFWDAHRAPGGFFWAWHGACKKVMLRAGMGVMR
jgi:hypothetical protein